MAFPAAVAWLKMGGLRQTKRFERSASVDGHRFGDHAHMITALIEQHNEWYPVERRLPMNPRTGDYVPVGGRSYRRPVLGPEWVLEQFPATPAD